MESKLGDDKQSFISNWRFADDVMLLASSLSQLKKMMTDFKRSTDKQGFKIHLDKTKLHTNQGSNKQRDIETDKMIVDILQTIRKGRVFGTDDHVQRPGVGQDSALNQMRVVFCKAPTRVDKRIHICSDTDFTFSDPWSLHR